MSTRFLLTTVAAACALALPAMAQSRPVTLSTTLKNYGGDGAYLAVYLTDAKGAYVRTLWVAGGKAKYYKHLADWNRLSAGDAKRLNGVVQWIERQQRAGDAQHQRERTRHQAQPSMGESPDHVGPLLQLIGE